MLPPDAEPFASGRDADVYSIDDEWVLRRYRNGHPVRDEAEFMKWVGKHGYPVPAVGRVDGPDMVIQVYPHYRDPAAVTQRAPHLHNVPLQIAAERGLPALATWIWFIVILLRDFLRKAHSSAFPSLATAALAGVVAMLGAGMFEYNFGDSEFLMLFLLLVTLPYAADRATASMPAVRHPSQAA